MRVDELSEALRVLFDMDPEDAQEVSTVVIHAFNGADEVLDEELDQDLRSIFYTLEAKKIMSFRREEYVAGEGDRRRAFFWRLREEEVRAVTTPAPVTAESNVYQNLPASVWARRAS